MSTPDEEALDPAPAIGSVLEGRYRLLGELGTGGIGWVFRAEHVKLGHHVAIKMLQARFVAHDQLRARFEREAKALAALSHPHIVTLTDYSIVEGHPYLVMELLEGRTLGDLIREGPVPEARARGIAKQILEALAYAHQRGFVHRDLKPDNVFLVSLPNQPDFVKVLDFGFVKLFDPDLGGPVGRELTRSGVGFGTPSYMSPEQASGDRTGPPTDVYALGITLFEMLAGHRPFVGEVPDVIRQQMTAPLPPLRQGDLVPTRELEEFLARATEKHANDRFASAVEMLEAFVGLPEPVMVPEGASRRGVASRRGERARRGADRSRRGFGIALALLLAAASLVFFGLRPRLETLLRANEDERAPASAPTRVPTVSTAPADPSPAPSGPASSSGVQASSDEGSAPSVPSAPASGATEATADDARSTPEATLGPSPFATRPRSPLLSGANRQIAEGRILTGSTEDAIERFARTRRDDPRPHLLLAANAFRQGQESVSLARYERAHRTAEDARNDPRMLRHLVRLAAEGRVTARAARAIERIYGPLAKPAIEREVERAELDPAGVGRLRRLLERL